MNNNAQATIEIVFIFSFGFLILLLFIGVSYSYINDLNNQKQQELVEDISFKIQREISLASSSKDGYFRNFSLPFYLGSSDYQTKISGNTLYVTSKAKEFMMQVPNVDGNVTFGYNIITKKMAKYTSTNKAQMWFSDFIVGIVIFVVSIGIFFGYFQNTLEMKNNNLQEVLADAKTISHSLVTAGYPNNWTVLDVNIIGLSQFEKGNFLDSNKFLELSTMGYADSKSTFGIKNDYAIFLKDETNCIIDIGGENYIGNPGLTLNIGSSDSCSLGTNSTIVYDSFDADNIVKTDRIFIYNSTLIRVEVYSWK